MRPLLQHLQGFSPVDLPRLNDIRISQSSANAWIFGVDSYLVLADLRKAV